MKAPGIAWKIIERLSAKTSCSLPKSVPRWVKEYVKHPWKLPKRLDPVNTQRRVIYVGYWLNNDSVPGLVQLWKDANITHVIFTFITQPDTSKPLSDAYSMTLAYKDLTAANKKLLTDNFMVGVSYGGSGAMPVPYSSTFAPGTYYAGNPEKLAQDLVALGGELDYYYDLDIEYINDQFSATAEFLGRICMELKRLKPTAQISHAPQPPYFTPGFGNVYWLIYNNYSDYFDFFNIQYYNNGPSQTFEQIFVKAPDGFGEVAVKQLISAGMKASYIVVGKPVNASEGTAGYVPLIPDLVEIINKAFTDPELHDWTVAGGVMIWFYNTQTGLTTDNQNILTYMNLVAHLN